MERQVSLTDLIKYLIDLYKILLNQGSNPCLDIFIFIFVCIYLHSFLLLLNKLSLFY